MPPKFLQALVLLCTCCRDDLYIPNGCVQESWTQNCLIRAAAESPETQKSAHGLQFCLDKISWKEKQQQQQEKNHVCLRALDKSTALGDLFGVFCQVFLVFHHCAVV